MFFLYFKNIVKNIKFDDEMQQFSINTGQQAVDRLNMIKNIALYYIRNEKYDHIF